MVRIWRLPATLIALEQRCSLRLLAAAFSAELAFVYSAAAAGPAILCRFVFRLLAAAVSAELTGIGSTTAAGPAALCRFRLRLLAAAVSAELAGVGSATAAGPGICCRCCCRRGGRGGRRRSRRLRLLRIRRLSVRRLLAVRILLSIHLLLLSLGKQASHICATGHSGHIHANKTAHCTHAAFIASCNTHSVCSSTSHSCCCTVRIAEHLDIFQTLSIFLRHGYACQCEGINLYTTAVTPLVAQIFVQSVSDFFAMTRQCAVTHTVFSERTEGNAQAHHELALHLAVNLVTTIFVSDVGAYIGVEQQRIGNLVAVFTEATDANFPINA